ncbi:MAG: carbohydrate kinase [Prevotella sp.]|nr:carbohydrate kinase [Prevotella sp.]
MENYIVGLGEILFDCLPDGKKLGGAPANFAYHASQFGLNGIAVSAIGDDENGREIVDILKAQGAKSHLETVDFPTGTVQVTLSGNGIPQYDICLGVAYDNIPWTPAIEEIAKNARAVCFGSLAQRTAVTRSTVQKFLDTMPQLGTLKVFDINLRQQWYSKEVIEENLNRCNVLKLNDEEICVVAELLDLGEVPAPTDAEPLQLTDFEDQCRDIMRIYDLQMIILTCGTNGSYVFHSEGVSFQPTPKVKVADTVGAGDSFTGSFVACVLNGKPIAEAHKTAVQVSAFVCSQNGAMPKLPEELTK